MRIAIIGSGNVGRALATSLSGPAIRSPSRPVTRSMPSPPQQRPASIRSVQPRGRRRRGRRDPCRAYAGARRGPERSRSTRGRHGRHRRHQPDDPRLSADRPVPSAAEKIQTRLPKAHVVKAFNTAFASRQADPEVNGEPTDGFVAGDNEAAKSTVLGLVGDIGFRPVDAGPLSMAHSLEAMALLGISLQIRNGGSWQSGWRIVEPAAKAP